MGQAWCKEKSAKAQDSKSPLDRVFVRCAHRIYPSLKEEGSVLGGATQRVTSSEIGYAGSPPREILARGRSIDSVDRPFHPSDWVDVNLEVPSPPRTSLVLTNSQTVDASTPYPLRTPMSDSSNIKDATPVPPPRRKRRNRGRPLPPKPDEIAENASEESLRSKTGDDQDAETSERICAEDARHDGRRTKDIYEHKVNGTGRIISSDVVSGKRTSAGDKKTWRTSEPSHHRQRKVVENEEYEKFARSQSIKDSSTPNRQDRRKSQELEKRIGDSSEREDGRPEANTRMKNYSTVSLPNYHELDLSRHSARCATGEAGEKTKSKRPVRSSTGSLPAESFLSPFSEKTSVRLEDYIPRRSSIEHLSPYQVLGKLGSSENEVTDGGFMKYDPSKLEDWDLSDISNCDSNRRTSSENLPRIEVYDEPVALTTRSVDVVDYSANAESSGEAETTEVEVSCVRRDVASRKADSDDSLADQRNSPPRYLEAPKMTRVCQVSPVREPASSFFLNEDLHRSLMDTIGGSSCTNGDRSAGQSRLMFGRSLSNESEPYDEPYESKELRAHSDVTSQLIRTISEESLPREMLDDEEMIVDFFDEGLMKNATASSLTPPPSPEPRIKARIVDNDHSSLPKVLNDEANGSNLSSMTPSLTELEAALSDMLEKEEEPRTVPVQKDDAIGNESSVSLGQILGGAESKSPKTRKVSFCTWQEEIMTEVDLRETAPGSNNSRVVESELPRSSCDFSECPQDGAKSRVAYAEADRLTQNLDGAAVSQQMPTPPRRRNRSSEGGVTKEPVGTVAETNEEADPYPNDRLI